MKTFLALILFTSPAWAADFSKTKLVLGSVTMTVELADTDKLRELGLMHREKQLKDTEGMIFVFDQAEPQGFWMKNTLIPLSIGFFDAKGKLFQVTDMEPASPMDLSPKVYHSIRDAKFALEEPIGWFKRKKIIVNQAQLKLPELKLP